MKRRSPNLFTSPLLLSFILSLTTVAGCSNIGFPGVYRINVDQGNIVDQDMVDQLKPEMTRRQVRFVLGTPIIEDTFNNDRWDYVRVLRRGDDVLFRTQLTVIFENDVLADVEGDLVSDNWPEPKAESDANTDAGTDTGSEGEANTDVEAAADANR
ncbi:MAG: outer membrane protein assembly factor BamE [Luminiphilus sp.]|nr:outer membrane protein assembly factor BamE [Luminiphilus sp.]